MRATLRNNMKPLFEVNFNTNAIETIRLFALVLYEVINLQLII